MKVYVCGYCGNPLYFENRICLSCQHPVGFDAVSLSMITLEGGETGTFSAIAGKGQSFRFCANATEDACNWLVPAATPGMPPDGSGTTPAFCRACALNRIIPALSNPGNVNRWIRIEAAKRRLIYSLLQLRLPVNPKQRNGGPGIAFDFMADVSPEQRVLTGHDEGTITLNIEEADEAERVRNKLDLGERYRTLLGHFRHEIGHYYWDLLIGDRLSKDLQSVRADLSGTSPIGSFRDLFGDERKDYGQALKTYYETGPLRDWTDHFISPYASAHPWEDWAETWAHYMHLMDTLETAYAFGVGIHPEKIKDMEADIHNDPYAIKDFSRIMKMWLPLTFALNSLNRSMGHNDFYPFVISSSVVEKLRFIHEKVGAGQIN
jgi:hypothetical protein